MDEQNRAARKSGIYEVQSREISRDDLEERLAGIWSESLKIAPIGRHDNFFELGGHSVLAMTLLEKVAECLSVQLPLIAIFRCPTVHEMADLLARRLAGASNSSSPDQLEEEDGIL